MVQIIRNNPRVQTLGGNLGSLLGQGLQSLAQLKMQDLAQQKQQQNTLKGLSALPGINAEQAQALSHLPQQLLGPVIKQYMAQGQNQAYIDEITKRMGGTTMQQQEEITPQGEVRAVEETGRTPSGEQPSFDALEFLKRGGTPQQALNLNKLDQGERKIANQINQQRLTRFTPYIKDIKAKGDTSREMVESALKLVDYLSSGNVQTGAKGLLLPTWLKTDEGQLYDQELARFRLLTEQDLKGRPTEYRSKLVELAKPGIANRPKVLARQLENILKNPLTVERIAEEEAAQELSEKWGEAIPENYKAQIAKLAKQKEKELKDRVQQQLDQLNKRVTASSTPNQNYKSLSEASKKSTGDPDEFIIDDERGIVYQKVDGKLVKTDFKIEDIEEL